MGISQTVLHRDWATTSDSHASKSMVECRDTACHGVAIPRVIGVPPKELRGLLELNVDYLVPGIELESPS